MLGHLTCIIFTYYRSTCGAGALSAATTTCSASSWPATCLPLTSASSTTWQVGFVMISITIHISSLSISSRGSFTLCQEWYRSQDPGHSLLQSLLEGNTPSFLSCTNLNHMSQDPPGTNYGTGLRAKTAQQMCDRWIPVLSSQVEFSKFSERRLPLSTTSLSTSQMIERAYDPPPLLPRTMTHSMSWILPDLWTLSKSFSICVLG